MTSPTGILSLKLVHFGVDRVWKGSRDATQTVYTGLGVRIAASRSSRIGDTSVPRGGTAEGAGGRPC